MPRVEIELTQGQVALIDLEDLELISKHRWMAQKAKHTYYAVAWIKTSGKRQLVSMHRFLLNCPLGKVVDHINHNGLDNRRSNLRICTQQQNVQNNRPVYNSSSRFKGVSLKKQTNRWVSSIMVDNKRKHLGYFDSEIIAAQAYNSAANELFGEFAYLNKVEGV